jgi:hypothetical protein
MGVITFVACKDCKTHRDLDKFYELHFCGALNTREEALEHCKDTAKEAFRCTLLLGFLSKHFRHNVFVIDDYYLEDELDGFTEDTDFWNSEAGEKKEDKYV